MIDRKIRELIYRTIHAEDNYLFGGVVVVQTDGGGWPPRPQGAGGVTWVTPGACPGPAGFEDGARDCCPDHAPKVDVERRLDLREFLVQEGWPQFASITDHVRRLFAEAVEAAYESVRGESPLHDPLGVPIYEGYADWLIIKDTYEAGIGALAERLAWEGTH